MADDEAARAQRRRHWLRLVGESCALAVGIVAAVELLVATGLRAVAVVAAVLLVAIPAAAVTGTASRLSRRWSAPLGWACLLDSGAAVIVATSCPPLGDVKAIQAVGLLGVATAMFVIPVVRGGYNAAILEETRTLGPLGSRVAPRSTVKSRSDLH